MSEAMDYFAAKAALEWQVEMGAIDAICETPINRYDVPAKLPVSKPGLKIGAGSNIAPIDAIPNIMPVKEAASDVARVMADKCSTLQELHDALSVFDMCALKKGARNTVFADGYSGARVMIIGDAPSREDDANGKPFAGPAGELLDKMFGAIQLSRTTTSAEDAIYMVPAMPWRTAQDRDPSLDDIQMMTPFLKRHIELINPEVLVLMGNIACNAVLGKTGVSRLRGSWEKAYGIDAMPMLHPSTILRDPTRKKDAWADLQELRARIGVKDGS